MSVNKLLTFSLFLFVVHNDSRRAGKHEAQEARKSLTENLPFFLLIFSPFVFTLLHDLINYQHFGSDEAKNSCITFIVCCPIASLSPRQDNFMKKANTKAAENGKQLIIYFDRRGAVWGGKRNSNFQMSLLI